MKQVIYALLVLPLILVLSGSCNDPSDVGAELVENDQSNFFSTDTLSVIGLTVPSDEVITFDPNLPIAYMLLGEINEPIFGKANSSFYIQPRLSFTSASSVFDFDDAVIDSVILSMRYDTLAIYGDTLAPFTVTVKELSEAMDNTATYNSDQSFAVAPTPIGTYTFYPTPYTRYATLVQDTTDMGQDTSYFNYTYPQLRIPLDNALGEKLLFELDSLDYENNESFIEAFPGLYVYPEETSKSMLSFVSNNTQLQVYFTKDEESLLVEYPLNGLSARSVRFQHDWSNALVNNYIDNPQNSDSLLFIQAMAGPNIKLSFPTVENLGDVIVNSAELEFTIADIMGDDTGLYPPASNIICGYKNSDGTFISLVEVLNMISTRNSNFFGGTVEEEVIDGQTIRKYTMKISSHFQNIINGSAFDNNLYLKILSPQWIQNSGLVKQGTAERSILYGAGSEYPIKLNIIYTKID